MPPGSVELDVVSSRAWRTSPPGPRPVTGPSPRQGHTGPGAPATGRTSHPPVEGAPRQPCSEGKLQEEEVDEAGLADRTARRTGDHEDPPLGQRVRAQRVSRLLVAGRGGRRKERVLPCR